MKKKKIKILILIFVLILLLILVTLQIIENKRNKPKSREEILNEQIESYLSDKICPKNMMALYSNYKGENDKNDLYRNFKTMVEYINELKEKITDSAEKDLSSFFQENSNDINKYLGIENENEFLILAKQIQRKNIKNKSIDYCYVDEDTFASDKTKKYLTFNTIFVYQDTKDTIEIKVYFAYSEKTKPEVKYGVIGYEE